MLIEKPSLLSIQSKVTLIHQHTNSHFSPIALARKIIPWPKARS